MTQDNTLNKKNIVIRLSSIGDILLITGVLDYWYKRNKTQFTVVTKKEFVCLLDNNPAIENIIGLEKKELKLFYILFIFYKLAKQYKDYTLIDLHINLRTFILKLFWKNKIQRYSKFTTERKDFLKNKNNTTAKNLLNQYTIPQRYALAIEKEVPNADQLLPQIYLTEKEIATGNKLLTQAINSNKLNRNITENTKIVAIHPYASHTPKAWQKEHWLSLTKLLDEANIPWICIGQNKEKFFDTPNDLTNKTNLRECAALLKACTLLITPDSGPMHLARAVKTPVIALFGPTVKEWGFYPNQSEGIVLECNLACRPCSLHGATPCTLTKEENCMFKITPKQVFNSVLKLLNINQS